MESLRWVDQTYVQKHKSEDPSSLRAMYYPNMRQYSTHGPTATKKTPYDAGVLFLTRYARKAGISLAVFALSYLPYVGRFVLPAASFYTFNKAVGPQPAIIIFGAGIFLPKRYLIMFLQSYFSSRSLMRELVRTSPLLKSCKLIRHSWSLILPVSDIPHSRRKPGFAIAKECSSDLVLAFSSFSRSLCWAF